MRTAVASLQKALTWWPLALCLLRLVAGWVLAGYRVGMLDLLCSRHGAMSTRIRGSVGGGLSVRDSRLRVRGDENARVGAFGQGVVPN